MNDLAYMLGLSDSDPYKIVLAKGPINGGIVENEEDTKILVESSDEYIVGDGLWHHISLSPVVQPNGDVVIRCWESDLTTRTISNPSWTVIGGFDPDGYIDGALQVNSGSAPLWGGYAGFACAVNEALNRRAAFDALQVYRAI